MADKPHMNLVFIGHVDHGKSTTVGRMLLDTGAIDPYVIEKFKKQADEKGAKHETNRFLHYGQRRLNSTRRMRFDRRMGTEEYSESD